VIRTKLLVISEYGCAIVLPFQADAPAQEHKAPIILSGLVVTLSKKKFFHIMHYLNFGPFLFVEQLMEHIIHPSNQCPANEAMDKTADQSHKSAFNAYAVSYIERLKQRECMAASLRYSQ
jgi:hypothetical protein